MPKYLSRNSIKGQTGINVVEEAVLGMGFKWSAGNGSLDTGIDGDIELVDPTTREAKNVLIRAQVKGRTHFENETASTFEFTCSKDDIDYWMAGNAPVILVVVRLGERNAWWVSVRDCFADPARRKSGKALFDKKQSRFDQHAGPSLTAMSQQCGSGVYLSPKRKSERLLSNLLEIKRLPSAMYMAETTHRDPKKLRDELAKVQEWPPREWFLSEGRLFSVHNLRDDLWRTVCDMGTVERIETEEWADSEEEELKHRMVRMLRECLIQRMGAMRIGWNRDEECHYFKASTDRATGELRPRTVSYMSLQKTTSRVVFEAYPSKKDPAVVAFYRHHGFKPDFTRIGGKWYMAITPRYLFTSDGKTPHPYREEYQSGIKRIEGGAAVRGIVVMFAALFQDEPSLYAKPYPHLGFGSLAALDSEVGIDDALWARKDELQPSAQTELEEVHSGLFKP